MSRALESLPGLSRPSSRAWVGLVLLAAGLLGPAVAAGLRAPASRFVVVYAVAVAGFLLLVSARDALPLRAVVVVAVLARVAFLPVAPALSDDHYRYLWDGRVQLAGVNPYLYAPEDARLDEVAFEGRDLVNHPDLRTPYPPLAQALFLGLAGAGVTTLKLVLGVADLLVAAAVWWLADAQRRRRALLLYLACPFVIVETWWSAHLDVLAALFVVLAAGLLVRRRDAPAGVALAAAVLIKVTPLALVLPALLGRRARPLPFLLGFLPALVLPALPYALTGGVFGSLGEAGLTWKAESAVFDVVDAAAGPADGEGDVRRPRRRRPPRPLAPLPRPGTDRRRLRLVVDPRGAPAAERPPLVLDRPRGPRPRRRRLDAGAARPRGAAPLRALAADAARRPARVDRHLPPRAGGRPRARRGVATPYDRADAEPRERRRESGPELSVIAARSHNGSGPEDGRAGTDERGPSGGDGRDGTDWNGDDGRIRTPMTERAAESARAVAGRPALVVMARALVPGRVKTRLAADVGDARALELYAGLLAGTLAQAERLAGCARVIALAGGRAEATGIDADRFFRDLAALSGTPARHASQAADGLAAAAVGHEAADGWRVVPQRGGTLGARLAAVFAELFADGAAGVVALNSDSPPIPERYLHEAVELVTQSAGPAGRLVVGPAADGGYYLIGTDAGTWGDRVRELLMAPSMGTAALLAATLRGAAERGLDVRQLPLWVDIDDARDLPVLERLTGAVPLRGEPLERLREVYLHVTHRCGHACLHCYNRDRAAAPGELTTARWKDAIDQCAALGASGFVFLGGDPLLRPDLTELIAHITDVHDAGARFFFNSFVSRETAEALAAAGHGRLRPLVSIDGPREVNDALRGEGNHAEVFASIANLQSAGLDPVANTVLVEPALAGLPQLARELRQAGVGRLHLILPHQHGGVPGDGDTGGAPVPGGAALLAAIEELIAVAGEIGLVVDNLPSWERRVGARNDFCASGCRDLAIDPYGRVYACAITVGDPAFVAGDLAREPLEQIWRGSPSLRLLRAAAARDRAECAVCPVVDACGGECWVQAHYAARAADRPAGYRAVFPYCDVVRPLLERLGVDAAAAECVATGACGGQAAAGEAAYGLFDCI